jgi:uncharacterized protein
MAMDIFEASMKGDLEVIRREAARSPDLLTSGGPGGWPALHLAAHFGQKDATALLLELGAPIEQRAPNQENNTPLHAAVAGMRKETAELLLEKGADITATYASGTRALHEAAYKNDPDMIRLLLRHGADPTLANDRGETPRAIAERQGNRHVAEMLPTAEGDAPIAGG